MKPSSKLLSVFEGDLCGLSDEVALLAVRRRGVQLGSGHGAEVSEITGDRLPELRDARVSDEDPDERALREPGRSARRPLSGEADTWPRPGLSARCSRRVAPTVLRSRRALLPPPQRLALIPGGVVAPASSNLLKACVTVPFLVGRPQRGDARRFRGWPYLVEWCALRSASPCPGTERPKLGRCTAHQVALCACDLAANCSVCDPGHRIWI